MRHIYSVFMVKAISISAMLLVAIPTFAIRITHGPYICDMDSTSTTIVWFTDKPGLSWVELAEAGGPDHFYGKERNKYFATRRGRKLAADTLHRVRINGLRPDCLYRYRIFTKEMKQWRWNNNITYGDIASSTVYKREPYTFKTYPAGVRDVSFLVLNDIHERATDLKKMCKDIDFSKLDFVLLNGDMSNYVGTSAQIFKGYIDTLVSMCVKYIPVFMCRGNHETRGAFADKLWDFFPTANGEFYRVQHVAGIDFLIIDSGEDKPDNDIEYGEISNFDAYREEQARWLAQLKKDGRIGKYPVVVFCHIPPLLQNWHGCYHLNNTILPELNRMNVSLMLSGHLHRNDYQAPGETMNFPCLVNSNMSYLLCYTKNGRLEVERSEENGKNKKHFIFELKH
ncbi:FN3 domain-containing metallophosphoesterase family protein [Prevotella sp. KH2C16]|uniref:FN3 domain-containing metallophosphoesterase family protein n=1 Tax=Prevotella sp. KH2C16 TaxID=1855325 RepID=UPI000B894CC9|nr:FN3 domain-containing metallophosphoesterase family protein [Prevotella sp. KH2C16]